VPYFWIDVSRRAHAAWLNESLAQHFGGDRVFFDVGTIRTGDQWLHKIHEGLRSSAVLVVVPGTDWLGASKDGNRRLDDPKDTVRLEISSDWVPESEAGAA
jgi:hypothetical protein